MSRAIFINLSWDEISNFSTVCELKGRLIKINHLDLPVGVFVTRGLWWNLYV